MSGHATTAPVHVETHYAPPSAGLRKLMMVGIGLAVVGGIGCIIGATSQPEQFARSYLPAYLLWIQIALGGLGLCLLNLLTHGAWGIIVRRVFESAAMTLPLFVVLFIPIVLGHEHLYEWSKPGVVEADPILQQKASFLDWNAFLLRSGLYFATFIVLAVLERRWSLEQDRTGKPALFHKMRVLSAAGLGIFIIAVTFAAFDWLMTIDAHWFSSIYGVQFVGGIAVAALTFAILVSRGLVTAEPMSRIFKPKHHQDHGTLLFAFLLLWGYFGVSQFIIIWSANLPEEIPFYMRRMSGGWQYVSVAIVICHWALPFLLLLSPRLKRNIRRLVVIATLVLIARWVDLMYQATPNFHPTPFISWMDFAALLGVGGAFLALFARNLGAASLLPVHDPFLPEALAHE